MTVYSLQKDKPYRNKRMLQAAKWQTCTLRIVCNGFGDIEETVACHSPLPEDNQGYGQKAHDFRIADGCRACHEMLDGKGLTVEEKRDIFNRANTETLLRRFRDGVIK